MLRPPFYARRVVLEAAPVAPAPDVPGRMVVVHAGDVDDAALQALCGTDAGAAVVAIPLDAGEAAIGTTLEAVEGQIGVLIDLRARAALDSRTAGEAAQRALLGVFRLARTLGKPRPGASGATPPLRGGDAQQPRADGHQGAGEPESLIATVGPNENSSVSAPGSPPLWGGVAPEAPGRGRPCLPARVVVATGLGSLGWAEPTDPRPNARAAAAYGAAAGAWKAVGREWAEDATMPSTTALRIVDLAPASADADWAALGREALRTGPFELALGGPEPVTPMLREAPLPADGEALHSSSVILLVGGGRGIVAQIALALARRFGCRLVLLGRTAAGADATRPFERSESRRQVRAALPEVDIHGLNRRVEQLAREHELAATLAALKAAGAAEVVYVEGDASRPEGVVHAVQAARERFGRLDAVVHGAGMDRSRPLHAKTEAEVIEVLSTKVGAASELFEAAAGAHIVAVGSVSGRYGNAGQVDYAAANESMAKLALAAGGLVVDYSAWGEVGMAAGLTKAMRERGVDPLDPLAAAAATVELMAARARGEWVIAGRLGEAAPAGLVSPLPAGEVVLSIPGTEVVRRSRCTLESLAYLRDHRSTQAGVLPGVVALEAMAHAAASLAPGLPLYGFRDVAFNQPIKVFPGRPVDVDVGATRGHRAASDAGALTCPARLEVSGVVHHTGTVLLGGGDRTAPQPIRDAAPQAWAPGPTREAIYRLFFHGPSFQVLAATEVAPGLLRARSLPLAAPLGEDLPDSVAARTLGREVAFQAAGAYLVFEERRLALPIGLSAINIFAPPTPGECVTALARCLASQPEGPLAFDVDLRGEDGRLLERLEGLTFRHLTQLPTTV